MTKEELFKKNFPEYVTEKNVCLSPYWDVFSAGIECATYELNKGIIQTLTKEKAELETQIEKLIDFVLSKTECCDVCPITDTCINSEGTCPYTGILAKGEEEVTREWLMQFISKED